MRSAIMVSNFIPFLMRYWLENFKKWEDEIDMVYIGMERPFEPSLEPYLRKLFKHPKIKLMEGYTTQFIGLTDLLKMGNEDTVMVLHDDTFFKKGTVDKYFKITEAGKIVTPLYSHISPADYIEKLMKDKFGDKVPFTCEGNSAYSFILYLFIAQRAQLEKTSMNFQGGHFNKGTYFKPLETVLEQDIGGDTGFLLGLELLANGEQFNPIPHKDNTPYYLSFKENPLETLQQMRKEKSGLFAADWLHIMSMANTLSIWLKDKKKREEQFSLFGKGKPFVNGSEMRMAWLKEFMSIDTFEEIAEYRDYVNKESDEIIKSFNLDYDRIKTYQELFSELI